MSKSSPLKLEISSSRPLAEEEKKVKKVSPFTDFRRGIVVEALVYGRGTIDG